MPTWMADIVGQTDMGASAKEKAERDARWIGDYCDELTVSIALREWDKAVDLVEKGELVYIIQPVLRLNTTQGMPTSKRFLALLQGSRHSETSSLLRSCSPSRSRRTASLL